MRVLTFNHHESFIFSLAQTGHSWHVITQYKSLALPWNAAGAGVPENMTLCHWTQDDVPQKLREGYYDAVVCHTLKNLLWMVPFRKNRIIFVAHIPLFSYTLRLKVKSLIKKSLFHILRLLLKIEFVAVSEFKRASWNQEGDVIVLAPRALPSVQLETATPHAVIVCNQIVDRADELGLAEVQEIIKMDIPIRVIGHNPGFPGAIRPRTREEFQKIFSEGYLYLYTIRQPYGDGYNTAMLEAMGMGMPIVTVENQSSPIRHNENGLIGKTTSEIASHILHLFNNRAEAIRLGENAKKTIDRFFSEQRFITDWNRVLMRNQNQ